MRLLLDTFVIVRLMMDSGRISPTMREILANPANLRFMSSASVWEILVKWQLGKLALPKPPAEFFAEIKAKGRIRPLPVAESAVLQLPKLPNLHRDPFDRMLICQAIEEGLTIVTPDELIIQYPIKTLWM